MSFNTVLQKYRDYSFSERDKGDRFERLMQTYLQTDPLYANRFKHVWLWNEFPGRKDLGGSDTGIDLVAMTFDGDYWAIQSKCYKEDAVISKGSLDSFLSTSSRTFKNERLQTTGFSQRLWISTTNKWGSNAEEAIKNQNPPFARLNLYELEQAPVDWDKLEKGITGDLARTTKKEPFKHQITAIDDTHNHFRENDRGKLIMACGTGKTFTSLRIAENETNGKGLILFLVPSIALLGQTLREWTSDAQEPINPICICSDSRISKQHTKNEDADNFSTVDLALPASTNVKKIVEQFRGIKESGVGGMTVVFSTYQSIEVIAKAQNELLKEGFGEFDLIICDEAHRTTGVTLADSDDSAFVKVHNQDFIKSKKRLYMTATPRLFSEDSKSKAAQNDAVLASMDDPEVYGEEIYRIGFGEAVERGLLTDYKVLILTLSDKDVPPAIQKMIANEGNEINSDDASKLIGCINAFSKQVLGDEGLIKETDPDPMKRAVAFCQNIKISKRITDTFNETTEIYRENLPTEQSKKIVDVSSRHIDGSMAAPQRDELLGWLKSTSADTNECRILTNVRCLSEGVDVPSLDSVLFLSARNSQVDVVQSVGRVMRKSSGKKYGYIIIPVVVPSNIEPSVALNDNERFKVVWTVLNALRAHDDRFNATINKIELNKKKPSQIIIGGISHGDDSDESSTGDSRKESQRINEQLAMQFEQLQGVVYAKMVQKVGDRVYWEKWAQDIAQIAENQISRITNLIDQDGKHQKAFENFLKGLQNNINPSISKDQAIEMLSQHIITKPVFEALFEGYSFVKNNAISTSMQAMLDVLEDQSLDKDTQTLDRFYASVKKRAEGIDNAEGKQRIIIELYDKFFKTAFPKMVEQLGIVYTPVEVVDFIIHSVNDVLKKEFGRSISDENIHILDPFTGTGTFITRLLQSGLIAEKDLQRKYTQELHANEIVLLAYYIAAVNIENAYHDQIDQKESEYTSFDGIVLTDTFQLGETKNSEKLFSEMFPQNSKRVEAQQKAPLRVIMGNPPYSIGQKSANDNAQNQSYDILDSRIANTYAALSNAGLNKSLYDAYIKAYRWSTDRLDPKNGGIIAFVSNGAWLDGNSTDGFRKSLEKEFSSIYVFNLRGNQRTSGELSRKEGGKIFGSGSRTPISITLLIKHPDYSEKAKIYYHDIGDYLSQKEKLEIISNFKSVNSIDWTNLKSNEHGDWINKRNDVFDTFIPIEPDKKFNLKSQSYFNVNGPAISSGRDFWVYNFSKNNLSKNVNRSIEFYSEQTLKFNNDKKTKLKAEEFLNESNSDPKKISWTVNLKKSLESNIEVKFFKEYIFDSNYRPFIKHKIYYHTSLIERPGLNRNFFTEGLSNMVINISGVGSSKGFSTLISDKLMSYDYLEKTQCFPLYYYEEKEQVQGSLFDEANESEYIRRDGVSDFIWDRAKKQYGKSVSKEDIFYYVYGILHNPDYRETFANDLKKMLPRIPLVDKPKDFWVFSKVGRQLADLHINYESVPPYEDVEVQMPEDMLQMDAYEFYRVNKLRFPKKDQKDTILYNSRIVIKNIPEKAYEYVVNGKSAIEWIMDRYQVKVDKKSGIKNDPNDWSRETEQPAYILDLLLSIINVSVQTVDIVNGLPKLEFE